MATNKKNESTGVRSASTRKVTLDPDRLALVRKADRDLTVFRDFDAVGAAAIAEANAGRIAPFRDEIVAEFGEAAGALSDELVPAARAAREADAAHVDASREPPEMGSPAADLDRRVQRVAAAELRNDALARLVLVNESLVRMIEYLRWHHGDADDIARSFRSGYRSLHTDVPGGAHPRRARRRPPEGD